MANHASAEKKLRRDQRQRTVNVARVSRIRTFIKKAEESFKAGVAQDATEAFRHAQMELMRGVSKGVFHKKTAARKVSRLAAKLNTIVTP
jgi:small subunit ribosomal protein S20